MKIDFGQRLARAISRSCQQFGATISAKTYQIGKPDFNDLASEHVIRSDHLKVRVSVYAQGETTIYLESLRIKTDGVSATDCPKLTVYFGRSLDRLPRLVSTGDLSQWLNDRMVLTILALINVHSNGRLLTKMRQMAREEVPIGFTSELKVFVSSIAKKLDFTI